jgi:hypothetical protein
MHAMPVVLVAIIMLNTVTLRGCCGPPIRDGQNIAVFCPLCEALKTCAFGRTCCCMRVVVQLRLQCCCNVSTVTFEHSVTTQTVIFHYNFRV